MKRLIWVGPDLSIDNNIVNSNISAAAYYWQNNFKRALVSNGVNVTSISYEIDRVWPFGRLYINSCKFTRRNQIFVSYLNLFFIRDLWIAFSIFLKSTKFREYDFITYNSIKRNLYFALLRKKVYKNSQWFSIIADDYVKFNPDHLIFLSYGYYNKYQHPSKYHFDGAIEKILITHSNNNIEKKKILFYSGAISEWTGINELVALFINNFNLENWEFHIYGKGDSTFIEKNIILNEKIKYFGFVEENVLIEAAKNAYVFVNPRPINIASGENNFPSKLLFYLQFGKYIISTKTDGLRPDFNKILIYSNFDSYNELKNILINIEMNRYQSCLNNIHNFQCENTWENSVKNLLNKIK